MSTRDAAFDHAYVIVRDLGPYLELAQRGFWQPPAKVEHPGGVTCKAMLFPCLANQGFGRSFQYLEFVHIADPEIFVEHTNTSRRRDGATPLSAEQLMLPGFSLVTGSARQRLARLPPRFSAHRPAVDHVNYRWQTESAPDAAGWTYLKFREPVLPFCDFWYTEYEPDPQNPSRGHPSIEPCLNTCQELIGCVWDLRGPERDLVQRVRELTDGELGDDALVLNEQFTIWLDEQSLSPLQALAQQGPFRAMVLGCASLATFKRLASPELVVQWRGQETAILTPYATGWAIVVVERPSPPGARGLTRVGAPL